MDFQRAKGGLILITLTAIVVGITYFLTASSAQKDFEKRVNAEVEEKQDKINVVVATKDIALGTIIDKTSVAIKNIPSLGVTDRNTVCKSLDDVVGRMAAQTIYANQQIMPSLILSENQVLSEEYIEAMKTTKNRFLNNSSRYITIDVPKYNFVNGRVKVGSLVDILIDKGQGRYDVVMGKVAVLDKIAISKGSSKTNSKVENLQLPRPSMEESEDYRITIMATEAEQKRLFEAATYGKFMLRLYVLSSQPESKPTAISPEEQTLKGSDGTVGLKLPLKKTENNTANTANTPNAANTTNPGAGIPAGQNNPAR